MFQFGKQVDAIFLHPDNLDMAVFRVVQIVSEFFVHRFVFVEINDRLGAGLEGGIEIQCIAMVLHADAFQVSGKRIVFLHLDLVTGLVNRMNDQRIEFHIDGMFFLRELLKSGKEEFHKLVVFKVHDRTARDIEQREWSDKSAGKDHRCRNDLFSVADTDKIGFPVFLDLCPSAFLQNGTVPAAFHKGIQLFSRYVFYPSVSHIDIVPHSS